MNGIVTPPPTLDDLTEDTPAGPDDKIACDDFWPEISISALRDAEKIGSDVPGRRIRTAIGRALVDITRELRSWRVGQEAVGYDTLADVPARQMIGDRTDYEILWERAVQSVVAADIGERSLTQSSTTLGQDRSEAALSQADIQTRNVRFAIRDFLGVSRIIAELI